MKQNILFIASCICSLLLIPIALFAGKNAFYVLGVVNFTIFHGIWISRYLAEPAFAFNNAFFLASMRIPLILFMIGGLCGMLLIF